MYTRLTGMARQGFSTRWTSDVRFHRALGVTAFSLSTPAVLRPVLSWVTRLTLTSVLE